MEEAVKDLIRWIDCQEDVDKWALGTRHALNRVRAALALKERAAPCAAPEEIEKAIRSEEPSGVWGGRVAP